MKLMPSATELRSLCQVDTFINDAVDTVLRTARLGEICHILEVPVCIPMAVAKERLILAFPECKIRQKWFTRYYEICWT